MSNHRPAHRRHRLDHNPRRGRYWRAPRPDDDNDNQDQEADLIILRTQFGWSLRANDEQPLLEALVASADDPEQLIELARSLGATAEVQED